MKQLITILFLLPLFLSAQPLQIKEIKDLPFFIGTPGNYNNFGGFRIPVQPNQGSQLRSIDAGQLVASKVDSFAVKSGPSYDTVYTYKSGIRSGFFLVRAGSGTQGPAGPQGPQGIQGPAGPAGPAGSGGGGTSGPIDTTDGTGGINQPNFKTFINNNTRRTDQSFSPYDFEPDASGVLYPMGSLWLPTATKDAAINGLTPTFSSTSSNRAGQVTIILNGSSTPSGGRILRVNFVHNYNIAPASVKVDGVYGTGSSGISLFAGTPDATGFWIYTTSTTLSIGLYTIGYSVIPGANASPAL